MLAPGERAHESYKVDSRSFLQSQAPGYVYCKFLRSLYSKIVPFCCSPPRDCLRALRVDWGHA